MEHKLTNSTGGPTKVNVLLQDDATNLAGLLVAERSLTPLFVLEERPRTPINNNPFHAIKARLFSLWSSKAFTEFNKVRHKLGLARIRTWKEAWRSSVDLAPTTTLPFVPPCVPCRHHKSNDSPVIIGILGDNRQQTRTLIQALSLARASLQEHMKIRDFSVVLGEEKASRAPRLCASRLEHDPARSPCAKPFDGVWSCPIVTTTTFTWVHPLFA